jgi:hypothetical protein
MQLFYYAEPTNNWTDQNLVHNRLNFKWYPSSTVSVVAEVRNRFFWGELVRDIPNYGRIIDQDNGYFDLSTTIWESGGTLMHSMIDRMYLDYTLDKWQIRLGRQRINWGMNLIWNPNDLFNTYSYFDFDYEERPGTDALKVQYYTSATSSLEVVYQLGENADEMALASRYVFNKWNYDFQILGGYVEEDWVLGTGWAGDIAGAGFRGELSWFVPRKSGKDEVVIASISGDYSFANQLYIHAGALLNSAGTTGRIFRTDLFTPGERSPQLLSAGKYALFGQLNYPFTPLFQGGLSGILNPSDESFFLSPSLSYSLVENLDLMFVGQLFFGDDFTEFGNIGQALYFRLKWSF